MKRITVRLIRLVFGLYGYFDRIAMNIVLLIQAPVYMWEVPLFAS